jgi:serine/threonine protein kinase
MIECRDIKPENILISHSPDPSSGLPVAKLLDFGLSKNAGAGSAAKTFVGECRVSE